MMMNNKYELKELSYIPVFYLFKVSKKNTRTIRKIYSTFPIKTQERRQ